jgi:hypothetical protein
LCHNKKIVLVTVNLTIDYCKFLCKRLPMYY